MDGFEFYSRKQRCFSNSKPWSKFVFVEANSWGRKMKLGISHPRLRTILAMNQLGSPQCNQHRRKIENSQADKAWYPQLSSILIGLSMTNHPAIEVPLFIDGANRSPQSRYFTNFGAQNVAIHPSLHMWKDVVQGCQKAFMHQSDVSIGQSPVGFKRAVTKWPVTRSNLCVLGRSSNVDHLFHSNTKKFRFFLHRGPRFTMDCCCSSY